MKTQSWYIQKVHMLWDSILFTVVLALNFNVNSIYEQYGTPYCVHSLNVPGLCLHICPVDYSFEPKHLAEVFNIDHYIYCCVIDWNRLLLHYGVLNELK